MTYILSRQWSKAQTAITFLKCINQLIFVIEIRFAFFEVGTKFLNSI